jgi:mono/diheme cytochrome c family protein
MDRAPCRNQSVASSSKVWSAVSVGVLLALGAAMMMAPAPPNLVAQGRQIFRFDTFGDEQLWTDTLELHEVIESALDPLTAFDLGLKVDVDALPPSLQQALANGQVDLTDPQTTLALIQLNAVVGVIGQVQTINGVHHLQRVGVSCAICHSTVDDSFGPNIGHRLDGWPNMDLDPGRIIALSPNLSPAVQTVYNSWGPGMYDPRFNIDGLSTPLVLPPAFGLRDVEKETYTAEGRISYWNKYVAVTQMGGQGTFIDNQLGIHIIQHPDLVKHKLKPLRAYQFSLSKPQPPPGSFNPSAAAAGQLVFNGAGNCASCHVPPLFTDINQGVLHSAEEVGQDPAYAQRTTTGLYRTTPLRALWQHPPYFHDGSAATLLDVVNHYNSHFDLDLTEQQKADLVEYLKSI